MTREIIVLCLFAGLFLFNGCRTEIVNVSEGIECEFPEKDAVIKHPSRVANVSEGIECDFPEKDTTIKVFLIEDFSEPTKRMILEDIEASKNVKLKEVKTTDGLVIAYSPYPVDNLLYSGLIPVVKKESLDKVRADMTLKEIIDLTGPGYFPPFSGISVIEWGCEGGSTLLMHSWGKSDEIPGLIIRKTGRNERHKDVAKALQTFLKGIKISGDKVYIASREELYGFYEDGKGYKEGSLKVGGHLSRNGSKFSLALHLLKITPEGILCRYDYVPEIEGIVQYSEYGTVLIKPKASSNNKAPEKLPVLK